MASYLWKGRDIRAQLTMSGDSWNKLHPEVQKRALAVMEEAHRQGLPIGIFEGWRSRDRQLQAMNKGASWTGDADSSYHRWGLAVDFVFLDRLGNWTWDPDDLGDGADQRQSESWQKLGTIIEEKGFQWGGRWTHFDGPHAQLPILSIAALKAAYTSPENLSWA